MTGWISQDLVSQTIQEWHLSLLIGVLLFIDILFLLPVTAVPSAILKSELVQLPYSVSAMAQQCTPTYYTSAV